MWATFGLVILGLVCGGGLAELYLRRVGWTPRTQIIRGNRMHLVGNAPVWGNEERTNRPCVERYPDRLRLLVFGSSISYGVDVAPDATFPALLEQRLNDAFPSPGFCVLNFSQPGFQFQQKIVVAQEEIPRYRPALILWEHWVEWREFRLFGDAAYSISDFRLRSDGFIGVPGLPGFLNQFLFLHLKTYQFIVIDYVAPRADGPSEADVTFALEARYLELIELARAARSKLAIYFAPPLDRPFEDTAASPNVTRKLMTAFAGDHGIATYRLEQELIGQDFLQLRLDPCCHYNAQGHRALAPVMEKIVIDHLGPSLRATPGPADVRTLGATARPGGADFLAAVTPGVAR